MTLFKTLVATLCLSINFAYADQNLNLQNTPKNTPHEVKQVDGYFVKKIGNLRVTALFDGELGLPRSDLINFLAEKANSLFSQNFVPVDEKNNIITDFSAFLVQTPTQNILVDAGAAQCFGASLGHVAENLKRAGVQPEQIDTILITHAHPDHLCGITLNGQKIYANAKVFIAKADVDYWTSLINEAQANNFFKPVFKMTREALKPYQDSGQLIPFTQGSFHVPNVKLIDTHGHTEGHSSYLIDGGNGQKFLAFGDIVHYASVQLPYPDAAYKPDTDSKQAILARKQIFEQASLKQWWIGAPHIAYPAIGHIIQKAQGFEWVPTQYRPN